MSVSLTFSAKIIFSSEVITYDIILRLLQYYFNTHRAILSLPAKDDHRTAFFGEDIHITLPALDTTEVVFKPSTTPLSEEVFYRNGQILSSRAKLNIHISHLVLEDVGEEDEGTYVVRNSAVPADVRRIILTVRGMNHNQLSNVCYTSLTVFL